eukprot:TRINITY_DN74493_c0_g1_i1.p1 TRINITY_DN74493_c0_g1~~TRINITY_DN74493_c0_g1_i1.p1  ORF type:complete len:589 (-),score=134.03 TRINITY_DN74493_c0_g1_i1:65-1657(-)
MATVCIAAVDATPGTSVTMDCIISTAVKLSVASSEAVAVAAEDEVADEKFADASVLHTGCRTVPHDAAICAEAATTPVGSPLCGSAQRAAFTPRSQRRLKGLLSPRGCMRPSRSDGPDGAGLRPATETAEEACSYSPRRRRPASGTEESCVYPPCRRRPALGTTDEKCSYSPRRRRGVHDVEQTSPSSVGATGGVCGLRMLNTCESSASTAASLASTSPNPGLRSYGDGDADAVDAADADVEVTEAGVNAGDVGGADCSAADSALTYEASYPQNQTNSPMVKYIDDFSDYEEADECGSENSLDDIDWTMGADERSGCRAADDFDQEGPEQGEREHVPGDEESKEQEDEDTEEKEEMEEHREEHQEEQEEDRRGSDEDTQDFEEKAEVEEAEVQAEENQEKHNAGRLEESGAEDEPELAPANVRAEYMSEADEADQQQPLALEIDDFSDYEDDEHARRSSFHDLHDVDWATLAKMECCQAAHSASDSDTGDDSEAENEGETYASCRPANAEARGSTGLAYTLVLADEDETW